MTGLALERDWIVSSSWRDLFSNAMVLHSGFNFSNHRQLELHLDNLGKYIAARMRCGQRGFFMKIIGSLLRVIKKS